MKIPSWTGAVIAWLAVLTLTALGGALAQWLIFADKGKSDYSYLVHWPILWIVYFYAALAIVENASRLVGFTFQQRDR